jgi:hypothetical protein
MRPTRLIIGDSLLRNVRHVNDCNVISLSGIRLEELSDLIRIRPSTLSGYSSILVLCGTNNVGHDTIAIILEKLELLVRQIYMANEQAIVLLSSILARPLDHDRVGHMCAQLNRQLKVKCMEWGVKFVAAHKITLKFGKPINDLFYDGIHLKQPGVIKLRQYLSQRLAEYGTKAVNQTHGQSIYLRRQGWKLPNFNLDITMAAKS